MSYTDDVPEAPGDWRVDHDVCMACGAPPLRAPELMGFGHNHGSPQYPQCYFNRQPRTRQEHDRAFAAAGVSCCGAVRYCGTDPHLVQRMRDLDASTVGPVPAGLAVPGSRASVPRTLVWICLGYLALAALWLLGSRG